MSTFTFKIPMKLRQFCVPRISVGNTAPAERWIWTGGRLCEYPTTALLRNQWLTNFTRSGTCVFTYYAERNSQRKGKVFYNQAKYVIEYNESSY